MIVCPTCGNQNASEERHCLRCGRPLDGIARTDTPASLPEALEREVEVFTKAHPPGEEPSEPPRVALGDVVGVFPRLDRELGALKVGGGHGRATVVEGLKAISVEARKTMEVEVPVKAPRSGKEATVSIPLDALVKADTAPSGARETVQVSVPEALQLGVAEAAKPSRASSPSLTPVEPTPSIPPAEPSLRDEAHEGGPPLRGSMRGLAVATVGVLALLGVGVVALVKLWPSQGQVPQGAQAKAEGGKVTIPAGIFIQGLSDDYRLMFSEICRKVADDPAQQCKEESALQGEIPLAKPDLPAFQLDEAEVSNAQWAACVEAKACPAIHYEGCANRTVRGLVPFLRVSQALKEPAMPVVCVTRDEAAKLCAWRGGRLPTHAEWEKAARGKDGFLFPWGPDWRPEAGNWAEQDLAKANISGKLDGHAETAPVVSMAEGRSPFGAYHMAGNAAEWVAAEPGQEAAPEGFARGGSWLSNPLDLRATGRLKVKVDERRTDVGFRCAYSAAP